MLLGEKVKLVPVTEQDLPELYDMWKDPTTEENLLDLRQ